MRRILSPITALIVVLCVSISMAADRQALAFDFDSPLELPETIFPSTQNFKALIPHHRQQSEPNAAFYSTLSSEYSAENGDQGRIWGGLFLAAGVGATVYGFLERGVYHDHKSVVRDYSNSTKSDTAYFTLYQKTHANPHTALLTSVGLFLNGTYWMLRNNVGGVNLEEYSSAFDDRHMGLYSMIFGSLVIGSSFLIPEYTVEQRRGYEIVTEENNRTQYFIIQDETREYSYRQFSVNIGAGLIYMGVGAYYYFFPPSERKSKSINWSIYPSPNGLGLSFQW